MEELITEVELNMQKALESLSTNFSRVRTGRANPNILNNIMVDYFGVNTPITQLGGVKTPEAHLLVFEPWDKSILSQVEKAILASDLGITPSNDGAVVRLPFPAPTTERRKELVKECKELAEQARVSIRNARRDGNARVAQLQKDGELPEDLAKRLENDIQKLTDSMIAHVEEDLKRKESEVMEV